MNADGIRELIAQRGAVTFRDFMELALYHPEHGYYGAGRAVLGRAGDYFTSVSVGPIYGELMAAQFQEMWEKLGQPEGFTIVEQGANDGAFAADVLGGCRREAPDFYATLRYELVEPVHASRERQRERLGEFEGRVGWRDSAGELPRFTGVHFSNELVDAFPVHLAKFREGEWREMYVTGELKWREEAVSDPAVKERLKDLPRIEGYLTEVNLEALRWAEEVARSVERGWVVVVDYGYTRQRYYAPERMQGTLECYSGHAKGLDPLARPGFCDLTAHVEFTSLARTFMKCGMQLAGFTDQHHFLTGIVGRVFAERTPTAREARGLKTLLHPEMLGRAFQVLGLQRGTPEERLAGFRFAREEAGLA